MKDGTGIAKAARPIVERNLELIASKNEDYGSANLIQTGVRGVAVRLLDKVSRALTLTAEQREGRNDESLADTFNDISNYGLIGRMLQDGLLTEKQKLVYLAGPIDVDHIDQENRPDTTSWRINVAQAIKEKGHAAYNPLAAFTGANFGLANKVTSINQHAIACCDIMIANLFHDITLGTCREIEFAKTMGVRVIVAVPIGFQAFAVHDLEIAHSLRDAIDHI